MRVDEETLSNPSPPGDQFRPRRGVGPAGAAHSRSSQPSGPEDAARRGVPVHRRARARRRGSRHRGPVEVPVGKAVLGRLLDVVGDPQDNGPALPEDTPRRSIHALPPLLSSQTSATDVFETGIKVIDLLTPMAQGGKAAMFGGAGVGKTVLSWS
jgi:flagellar biosynthesis/type III secretory pathway ATPase